MSSIDVVLETHKEDMQDLLTTIKKDNMNYTIEERLEKIMSNYEEIKQYISEDKQERIESAFESFKELKTLKYTDYPDPNFNYFGNFIGFLFGAAGMVIACQGITNSDYFALSAGISLLNMGLPIIMQRAYVNINYQANVAKKITDIKENLENI
ncbi:MAG: hypothetical protein JW791_00470 [Nanoarchaeota archaeon]|nr:hypothetical protein [Nanoarchaeota archaeon]